LTVKANCISFVAMTTSYLGRGAARIAYDVQGDGPLVVCLPGMGDLRSVFRFMTPDLVAAGYRVATMDLRGHGDSDDGFDAYDDVAEGEDALALIAQLSGGPALLVGNSMGAGAAVWAAAEDPAKVAGLALLGPFVRNPKVNPVMALAMRLVLVKPWGPSAWRAYYRRSYPGRQDERLAEHQREMTEAMRRGEHWRSFVKTTRTDHTPAEERLGRVSAPALVVMGEKDQDWPDPVAEARFAADALSAELLLVPDCGHYPQAEYPDIVNPAVVAFAQRVHPRA
jgi:pimeloyl-ACP methyl ester carboxylesterase